jgi:hypothetical protein
MALIDAANAADPVFVPFEGTELPRALVDSIRVSRWVERLDAGASEALRLAARAHHLRRWEHPRKAYPEGRGGYLRWRSDLLRFHADAAAALLRAAGYDDTTPDRAAAIIRKERLAHDPEVRTLEDAVCLVFLEAELAEFAGKVEREKLLTILKKSWGKMSEAGREAALGLALGPAERALVKDALSEG